MNRPHLIDIATAAQLTGLDKSTIYRLARLGRLRTFRPLGRAVRFDRAQVLSLLDAQEGGTR